MMKITYIGHSGFFVEMEDACFLFDYYKGTIPETDGNKKMYVFVSHRHHDHYNEEIFRLQEKFRDIQYIISSDVYELASHHLYESRRRGGHKRMLCANAPVK